MLSWTKPVVFCKVNVHTHIIHLRCQCGVSSRYPTCSVRTWIWQHWYHDRQYSLSGRGK